MMSKDRVHFYFINTGRHGSQADAQVEAAGRAFKLARGVTLAAAEQGVEIVCRPSQFARFLIYRGEAGGQNLIKALRPRLVTPPPPAAQPIDVSKSPA